MSTKVKEFKDSVSTKPLKQGGYPYYTTKAVDELNEFLEENDVDIVDTIHNSSSNSEWPNFSITTILLMYKTKR